MYGQLNRESDSLEKILGRLTDITERLSQQDGEGGTLKKTPASFSTYTPLHGVGGIWAVPGLERDIISAHVRPTGIGSRLPRIGSVYTNPLYGTLTGYTGTSGEQPAAACDDAPTGYVKGATLTAQFGRIRYDTNTIDLDDVMLRLHRGDFTDLMLRGQVLGLSGLDPVGMRTNMSQVLNVATLSEMVGVGVNFERELVRQTWQGSKSVANEFPGLSAQIATGQLDAITGQLVTALDSYVANFNYGTVGGASPSIVQHMSMMEFYLRHKATRQGLLPVTWAFVMRPELWFELTNIWPCQYNTYGCTTTSGNQAFVLGDQMVAIRDQMRNSLTIPVNGNTYPVILDDGILEEDNGDDGSVPLGAFGSSIYMVPLTITGGFPVTYFEHVDYRAAQADVNQTQGKLDIWWTDNGAYSWALEQIKWCFKIAGKTEQRIVLRTPQLAGRIDNVVYSPLVHLPSPFPDDPYFQNGGVSTRSNAPSFFTVW